jgi:hypothetical protein
MEILSASELRQKVLNVDEYALRQIKNWMPRMLANQFGEISNFTVATIEDEDLRTAVDTKLQELGYTVSHNNDITTISWATE